MRLQGLLPLTKNVMAMIFALLFVVNANAQAPANDDCSGAILLNVDTVCNEDTFSSVNATASAGAPAPGCGFYQGGDVWFKAQVPSSGNIRVEVRGISGINAQFALYTDSCSALTWYSCNQLNPDRTIVDPSLAGKTIYIRVYNYNSATGGTFRICVWEPTIPVNNNCADAIFIPTDTVCNKVAYTNAYSTPEPTSVAPNPSCGFFRGSDVWFKFVAPASGNMRFEVTGLGSNPQYAVYSGSCGSFTQLYCGQLNPEYTYVNPSVGGDTLYLRVYSYNDEDGGGFQVCIWEPELPVNNDCADAIFIPTDTVCNKATYTNAYATPEPTSVAPNPSCGFFRGSDVWFKFVAPASGNMRFEVTGLGSNPQYAVYSGSCGSFTQLYCGQLNPEYTYINPSVGGDTLYMRIYSYNDEDGGNFQVCIWEPEIPINNNCADAIFLPTDTICNKVAYTNRYATGQPTSVAPNPSCGFYQGGDVWFKFVVPASGELRFEVSGLGSNPQYAVYSGSCGSFTQVLCAQLDQGRTHIDTSLAGDTLYLRVYSYNSEEGGDFEVCIFDPPIPVNNNCADALPLTVGTVCNYSSYTNRYATSEATSVGPNPSCGFYRGGDVWFTLTMPLSGKLTIQRQNVSGVNAQFALYSGSCGSFTQLSCAQLSSTINFNDTAYAGQTLYLRLYNYNSDEGGDFNLCAFDPSPVITNQPKDSSICAGNNAAFSIVATNATSYQWQENTGSGWNNINNGGVYSNSTTPILTLTNVPASMNGYQYRCIATGTASPAAISAAAILEAGSAPVFTSCPANIAASTSAGRCDRVQFYTHNVSGTPAPVITHIFSGATTGSGNGNGTGSTFNKGVTSISVIATNKCGADTCNFTITITDNEVPSIVCPSNITVNADSNTCGAVVNYTPPVGTDNCTGAATARTAGLGSGATFPVGTTTETYTVTDASGNKQSCSFTVTVVDNEAPSIVCPANITVNNDNGTCGAVVNYTPPVGTDNCTGAATVRTAGLGSGGTFPVGTTTETYTVTDASGNKQSCSFTVTVVDNEAPSIVCPANITVNNDNGTCGAVANYTPPVGTDNCTGAATVRTAGLGSGGTFPVGTTTETYTVTDASGNKQSCSFTVTVVDNEAPIAVCSNITVTLVNGIVSITTSQINNGSTDNCGIAGMSLSKTTFTTADIGNNPVILTVTDIYGNSATCTSTVTVQGPVNNQLSCSISTAPGNNTYTGGNPNNIYLGYGPQSATITCNATGGSGYSYSWSPSAGLSCTNCQSPVFTPGAAGNYTYTVTVTDNNNNTTNCSVNFCVQDIRATGKGNNNKVYLCHNGNTISISVNAVPAHLNNHSGDALGKCSETGCSAQSKPGRNEGPAVDFAASNEENDVATLTLYPNPNDGTFRLKLPAGIDGGQLQVTDMMGKTVNMVTITSNSSPILSMPELPAGVYIVELNNGTTIFRTRMTVAR
jgi:hypothetical protein